MREIEFRGQRVDTKEWVYGNLVVLQHEDGKAYYIIPFLTNGVIQKELMLKWISPCFEVIPETVGQYTGLKDKNGKKIFEGDICLGTRGGSSYVFEVKRDEKDARFIGYTSTGYICYVGQEPSVEVIGNICENPELIKGE